MLLLDLTKASCSKLSSIPLRFLSASAAIRVVGTYFGEEVTSVEDVERTYSTGITATSSTTKTSKTAENRQFTLALPS
jgi:hypothetical protein